MTTFWSFFRVWGAREAGRWCRRCFEPIARDDPFGRSEGVCAPCRAAAE
jgi:formamidopyrimidine-DNA glycosylase